MKNRRRTRASKLGTISAAVSALILLWGLLSWADVIVHNFTDQNYAWWNLIVLFTKVAVMAVG